ncbi:OmpH family outer membrane protein [Ancylomarina euxinus]|uniref:OmpH family outer membrane protein n=1 Tax=Ancylomarina euxinus TaxID=2283627 RepID=A0A425XY05_9BACT|nr:OmpH family outer membrane protein [Ancylomarina euxinus]MCZ4695897.1 OmpH family outer membrane protein [Ancylomarina euxinus]MUP16273.1 OmpH family outer membrane protein [Ancylomarina euxinus]RRG19645.1 OmpH family outer membrane protein [Ancylomarina euxinus]
MKRILKVTLLAVVLLTSANTFAQTLKLGHIDSSKLLAIMPEKDMAQKQIETKAKEFDTQIKAMQAEYQKLVEAYVAERETLSDAIRADREKAIQDLQNRMQTFDQFAQNKIQTTRQELLKPIFDKASKAIQEVGEENGFTYVLDLSTGVVLFNSSSSIDIMPLVKTKLGIQ